ncbi:hypothetical protein REPUB_Repub20aG0121300 [Reevesia pubescens]
MGYGCQHYQRRCKIRSPVPSTLPKMEISHESQRLPLKDRRVDALGNLNSLPDELICTILDYLTPRDIARLACVSRTTLDESLPQETQRSTSVQRLLEKDYIAFREFAK